MAWIKRVLHILAVLLAHAASRYAGHWVMRIPIVGRRLPPHDLSGPERLRSLLEDLGGSFIKFGQMLALQPDILPEAYCNALYSLLDQVTPVPVEEVERVFAEDIGRAPSEAFDSFDRRPLASGSIGQVHVAMLRGKRYAVKVQRPDAESEFNRDIQLMRAMVWLISTFRLPMLQWMIDPLTEFAGWTTEELDFRKEADHMQRLRSSSLGSRIEYVPEVLGELTSRRTLVVEFLEGIALLEHLRRREPHSLEHQSRLESLKFDADQFSRNIIDNFLGDAFRHGIFHADLHPANLMILEDNVVGYIDFGITGIISQYSRENLVNMTLAYANGDLELLCERFFAVSTLLDDSDPVMFREGLKRLSEKWYTTAADGEEHTATTVTMVMLDMLKLARRARILPQRDVIKYIRSCMAIDGLVRRFAPEFDSGAYLASACRRFLSWHARRSLLSHNTMLDWLQSNAGLMHQGATRTVQVLDHMAGESSKGRPARRVRRRREDRTVQLAAVAAGVGVLFALGDEPIELGWNMVTAQLTVFSAAVVGLAVRVVGGSRK